MEIVEDVNIPELIEALEKRNMPECWRAAYVIRNLMGKKTVVPAPVPEPVPGELTAVEEPPAPAPVSTGEAVANQDP